jgi:hypothetical protein
LATTCGDRSRAPSRQVITFWCFSRGSLNIRRRSHGSWGWLTNCSDNEAFHIRRLLASSPARQIRLYRVALKSFRTGRPLGVVKEFNLSRCFRWQTVEAPDSLRNLVEQLQPQVSRVSTVNEESLPLFRSTVACYSELFPDRAVNDEPDSLISWLDQEYGSGDSVGWKDVLTVLHLQQHVVGLLYLCCATGEPWAFGNYIGVKQSFRHTGRAKRLFSAGLTAARAENPRLRASCSKLIKLTSMCSPLQVSLEVSANTQIRMRC